MINTFLNVGILVAISLIFIFLASMAFRIHGSQTGKSKNPVLTSLGIAFSSVGGGLLASLLIAYFLPDKIASAISEVQERRANLVE